MVSSGAGGRWRRRARTAASVTAASFASTFAAEDEPVIAQEYERIDMLGRERLASGGSRTEDAESHLRVEWLGRALESGGQPRRYR